MTVWADVLTVLPAAVESDYFAQPHPTPAFPELSHREREILVLIARRRSNAEIARQLGITLKTAQNHVSNIFSKLQMADRAEAVIRAREAGLGS